MSRSLAPSSQALYLLVLSIAVVLIVALQPAAASTITVPTDYPTIQLAIDAASDGDVILVLPGTYNENIFVDKSVSIIGLEGYTNTTINSTDTSLPVVEITASDVLIKGFTIEGWTDGVVMSSCSNVTLSSCVILVNSTAINASSINGLTLKDLSISGYTGDGVYVNSSSDVALSYVTISGFDYSLYLENVNGLRVNNSGFYGFTASSLYAFNCQHMSINNVTTASQLNQGAGIYLWGCLDVAVENSLIKFSGTGIHIDLTEDVLIVNTSIFDFGYYGLQVETSSNITLRDVDVYPPGYSTSCVGVYFYDCDDMYFSSVKVDMSPFDERYIVDLTSCGGDVIISDLWVRGGGAKVSCEPLSRVSMRDLELYEAYLLVDNSLQVSIEDVHVWHFEHHDVETFSVKDCSNVTIAGVVINGTVPSSYPSMLIEGSSTYPSYNVTIKDVLLVDSSIIKLSYCDNVSISNVTTKFLFEDPGPSSPSTGVITIYSCNNVTISNSTLGGDATFNSYGRVTDYVFSSVYLDYSSLVTLVNNTLYGSRYGLFVDNSYDVTLRNNTFSRILDWSIKVEPSGSLDVDLSNVGSNGKPIMYLENAVNTVITGEYSLIYIYNGENITITDVLLSNDFGQDGVYLDSCTNVTLDNVSMALCRGVYAKLSINVSLVNCSMVNCIKPFYATSSTLNLTHVSIRNWLGSRESNYYMEFQSSELDVEDLYVEIKEEQYRFAPQYGMYFKYCSYTHLKDVACDIDSYLKVLKFDYSNYVTLENLTVQAFRASYVLYFYYSSHVTIKDFTVNSSTSGFCDYGLYLYSTDYVTVENYYADRVDYGVYVYSSDYVDVKNCTVKAGHGKTAFKIRYSNFCNFTNCHAIPYLYSWQVYSYYEGFYLYGSDYCNFTRCYAENYAYGFYMSSSNYIDFENCSINTCYYGVYAYGGYGGTNIEASFCNFTSSYESAMYIKNAESITLSNCNLSGSGAWSIELYGTITSMSLTSCVGRFNKPIVVYEGLSTLNLEGDLSSYAEVIVLDVENVMVKNATMSWSEGLWLCDCSEVLVFNVELTNSTGIAATSCESFDASNVEIKKCVEGIKLYDVEDAHLSNASIESSEGITLEDVSNIYIVNLEVKDPGEYSLYADVVWACHIENCSVDSSYDKGMLYMWCGSPSGVELVNVNATCLDVDAEVVTIENSTFYGEVELGCYNVIMSDVDFYVTEASWFYAPLYIESAGNVVMEGISMTTTSSLAPYTMVDMYSCSGVYMRDVNITLFGSVDDVIDFTWCTQLDVGDVKITFASPSATVYYDCFYIYGCSDCYIHDVEVGRGDSGFYIGGESSDVVLERCKATNCTYGFWIDEESEITAMRMCEAHSNDVGVLISDRGYIELFEYNNLTYNNEWSIKLEGDSPYADKFIENFGEGNVAGYGLPILYIDDVEDSTYSGGPYSLVVLHKVDNVTLEDVTVEASGQDGIYMYDCLDLYIKNCTVSNCYRVELGAYDWTWSELYVSNTTIEGMSGAGLYSTAEDSDIYLEDCTFKDAYDGVCVYGDSITLYMANCSITHSSWGSKAIEAGEGDVEILECLVANYSEAIRLFACDAYVTSCNITDCTYGLLLEDVEGDISTLKVAHAVQAIELSKCDDVTMTDVDVTDTLYALSVEFSNDVQVTSLNAPDCEIGVEAKSSDVELSNCNLSNCDIGVKASCSPVKAVSCDVDGCARAFLLMDSNVEISDADVEGSCIPITSYYSSIQVANVSIEGATVGCLIDGGSASFANVSVVNPVREAFAIYGGSVTLVNCSVTKWMGDLAPAVLLVCDSSLTIIGSYINGSTWGLLAYDGHPYLLSTTLANCSGGAIVLYGDAIAECSGCTMDSCSWAGLLYEDSSLYAEDTVASNCGYDCFVAYDNAYMYLHNCTLENPTYTGVTLHDSSVLSALELRVEDAQIGLVGLDTSVAHVYNSTFEGCDWGISVLGNAYLKVEGSTVKFSTYEGIVGSGGSTLLIERTTIYNNSRNCLLLMDQASATCLNCTFANSSEAAGVWLAGSSSCSLANSTVTLNTWGMVTIDSSQLTINSSDVYQNVHEGLVTYSSSNASIYEDTWIHDNERGVTIRDSSSLVFDGLIVEDNQYDGIVLWGSSTLNGVHGNFTGNMWGIVSYEDSVVEVHYCNFWDNVGEGVYGGGTITPNAEYCWWGDPNGPFGPSGDGVYNTDYDPYLTSPASW